MGPSDHNNSADAEASTPFMRLVNVSKTFRMGEVDVPVLRGVELDIPPGRITVVLGPSGSGKSTLLNLIGGIDRPTEGEIHVDGQRLDQLDEAALTNYRRNRVGFIFQFYNLVPTLTARENVEVSTEIAKDPMDPFEALARVGLEDRAGHFPSQLSGGEQQRVAIARALAKKPRLLLCDEPTGALDVETGKRILGLLVGLGEDSGTTMVIITHAAPIASLGHKIVRLISGRIVRAEANTARKAVEEITW